MVSSLVSAMSANEKDSLCVLVASTTTRDVSRAESFCVRFSSNRKISARAIVDDVTTKLQQFTPTYPNLSLESDEHSSLTKPEQRRHLNQVMKDAYQLCQWADILILAPVDAGTIGRMLNGLTGNLLLEVLRGWDVSKTIIMVPGMTDLMWENPVTRMQLSKIRKKFPWIKVMSPILWHFEDNNYNKVMHNYDGFNEIVDMVQNHAGLMLIGHDVDIGTSGSSQLSQKMNPDKSIPAEIWSMIFEATGDWELAMAMGVYTTLPTPPEWQRRRFSAFLNEELQAFSRDLEWTILTKTNNVRAIITKLSNAPSKMLYLSSLSVKLIIKFGLTEVLTFLESNLKEVFSNSFGSNLLPTKASAVYGRPEILEWWRTSPSFLKKDYTSEAIDGASKSGFVHVLEWWRRSGLDLKYTETALEQASSKGHLHVLDWWKQASLHEGNYYVETDPAKHTTPHSRNRQVSPDPNDTETSSIRGRSPVSRSAAESSLEPPLRLKVGKSIIAAAQNGRVQVIRWWDNSGIPYSHSEAVARIASAHGHVGVLEAWKELKGDKLAMSFDNQVLVGPTKNGFVKVLEWWKTQTLPPELGGLRLRVEYKTCDIEEALEDSVRSQGGEGEAAVRKWWAMNGLNLGLGTSEWMSVKVL